MYDVTFFNSVCTKRIINFLLSPDQSFISVSISNVRALCVHIALEGVGSSHETNHLTVGGLPGGGGGSKRGHTPRREGSYGLSPGFIIVGVENWLHHVFGAKNPRGAIC
jgi:hypothetical protein